MLTPWVSMTTQGGCEIPVSCMCDHTGLIFHKYAKNVVEPGFGAMSTIFTTGRPA